MRAKSGSGAFGRRDFTLGMSLAGLGALWSRHALAAPKAAVGPIRIGYAAITWGDKNAKQAIADIAAAGYPGVQLRGNILKDYQTADALKAELAAAKLTFACFSGGGASIDPATRADSIEKFVTGAKFAHNAGALVVQATSPKRGPTAPDKEQLKAFAGVLNEIGKRTAEFGLPLGFHNHMGQIGQNPDEVEAILDAADPKYVKLLLDTGHYAAAGGDPVKAIKAHGKRLVMLHIKDVKDKPPGPAAAPNKDAGAPATPAKAYEFVELGDGKVDFKPVFGALKAVGYKGWVVIELDSVPAGRNPKDAAAANKAFLQKTLGLVV
jgi:inosose dehydratase